MNQGLLAEPFARLCLKNDTYFTNVSGEGYSRTDLKVSVDVIVKKTGLALNVNWQHFTPDRRTGEPVAYYPQIDKTEHLFFPWDAVFGFPDPSPPTHSHNLEVEDYGGNILGVTLFSDTRHEYNDDRVLEEVQCHDLLLSLQADESELLVDLFFTYRDRNAWEREQHETLHIAYPLIFESLSDTYGEKTAKRVVDVMQAADEKEGLPVDMSILMKGLTFILGLVTT